MQDLRFVSVEDGWILATTENGQRFRLRADDTLRSALRPQVAPRSAAPKVPPRQIQQLIRSGRSVAEVVEITGADEETVARFEGPIIAERQYMVEQARAVAVRLQQQIDPLAAEGLNFGAAIDARLEEIEGRNVIWDAWKDPEDGWHIGLEFTTGDVTRNALWHFDPRGKNLRPLSPAAVSLSQQEDAASLSASPQLRAIASDPTDNIIPAPTPEPELAARNGMSATTHETADLLEALRKRRGERQHSVYSEEFEFEDDDNLGEFLRAPEQVNEDGRIASVTPFARPGTSNASDIVDAEIVSDEDAAADDQAMHDGASRFGPSAAAQHQASDSGTADAKPNEVADKQPAAAEQPDDNTLDLGDIDTGSSSNGSPFAPATPRHTGAQPTAPRRKTGRPSMPSWDEIVFGTRTDDE